MCFICELRWLGCMCVQVSMTHLIGKNTGGENVTQTELVTSSSSNLYALVDCTCRQENVPYQTFLDEVALRASICAQHFADAFPNTLKIWREASTKGAHKCICVLLIHIIFILVAMSCKPTGISHVLSWRKFISPFETSRTLSS